MNEADLKGISEKVNDGKLSRGQALTILDTAANSPKLNEFERAFMQSIAKTIRHKGGNPLEELTEKQLTRTRAILYRKQSLFESGLPSNMRGSNFQNLVRMVFKPGYKRDYLEKKTIALVTTELDKFHQLLKRDYRQGKLFQYRYVKTDKDFVDAHVIFQLRYNYEGRKKGVYDPWRDVNVSDDTGLAVRVPYSEEGLTNDDYTFRIAQAIFDEVPSSDIVQLKKNAGKYLPRTR